MQYEKIEKGRYQWHYGAITVIPIAEGRKDIKTNIPTFKDRLKK